MSGSSQRALNLAVVVGSLGFAPRPQGRYLHIDSSSRSLSLFFFFREYPMPSVENLVGDELDESRNNEMPSLRLSESV
jgi:hypothetical protein